MSLKAALRSGWFCGCGFQCEDRGREAFGSRSEGDVAAGRGSSEDCDGLSCVKSAIFFCGWGLEWIVVEQVSVVDGDDVGGTGGGEVDAGFAVGNDGVIGVDEGGGYVSDVVPVRG